MSGIGIIGTIATIGTTGTTGTTGTIGTWLWLVGFLLSCGMCLKGDEMWIDFSWNSCFIDDWWGIEMIETVL